MSLEALARLIGAFCDHGVMSGDRGGRRRGQDAVACPDVELLHAGSSDDQLERLPPRRPIRWTWWLALAVVAAVLVAVLVYRSRDRNSAMPPAPSHSSGPTPGPSRPRPPLTGHRRVVAASRAPVSAAPVKAVTVTGLGGAVVPAAAGTDLFARGRSTLLRAELATGRITETQVPPLPSNGFGFISFLVGPDRVIVNPPDSGSGYLVRDGRPAQTLDIPAFSGPALPGPDARHVWVSTLAGDRMRLVGLDGRASGPVLQALPGGSRSDGAGYLAYGDTSGVYDVRPDGVHRITTGELLAVGPTGWLVAECDTRHRCDTMSINQLSGQRRTIGARRRQADNDGVICADGSTAALFENNPAGTSHILTLLDLRSGHARTVHVALPQDQNASRLVWTPDSRYLFTVDANGRIAVVDKTGHVRLLPATLPPVTQLALRTPTR